jgi:hypothetical protein
MTRLHRLLAALAALLVLAAVAPAARADADQEAMFQDDDELIYQADERQVLARLDELAALGVDRIRVTVLWQAVAPKPGSRNRPSFEASDPAAYSPGTWTRYDRIVVGALDRGMRVNFNLTGPAPLWATERVAPRDDIRATWEPSPTEFAQFVAAVGRRYDGSTSGIPRVDYWSIWNEPNHSNWLTPTWDRSKGEWYEASALTYRELLDAAYAALADTGHGGDTILIGDTAPSGTDRASIKDYMKPLVFLRALYCVDERGKRLTRRRAKVLDCGKSAKAFKRNHPGLFRATGFAHHPYQLLTAPSVVPSDKDLVTMAVLGRLTRFLDGAMRRYDSGRRYPVHLTEFGYQTRPDPRGLRLGVHGEYLNEAEWMASRNGRVRSMAQFLLVDDGPPIGDTFQSGLILRTGERKPAYGAYALPVWVWGRGPSREVWAVLRPAPAGTPAQGVVLVRPRGEAEWRIAELVDADGPRHVIRTSIDVRRGDRVRVAYGPLASRTVRVR